MQNFIQSLRQSNQGQAHGLTGINGIGKTTYMMALRDNFVQERLKVSICTQKPLITLNHWRVQDIIRCLENDWESSLDLTLLQTYKKEMGLEKNVNTPVMKLSGGENQILKIYLCLAMRADFYFLDEPTTYLDLGKKEFLLELLKSMKLKGRKIFFIEHDEDFSHKLADEIWVMKASGHIVKTGEELIHV
ncbi:MAG: ABC transporter ATP-binding protein [Bacteriovoracaceae bacterium]